MNLKFKSQHEWVNSFIPTAIDNEFRYLHVVVLILFFIFLCIVSHDIYYAVIIF